MHLGRFSAVSRPASREAELLRTQVEHEGIFTDGELGVVLRYARLRHYRLRL